MWVGGVVLATSLAGCADELDEDDENGFGTDEHLSKAEAAEYADEWVQENLADRDEEAFEHYQTGVEAISTESYSRAIYELENATELYDELCEEAFDKRNQYDEDQNRYELFELAWDMYRLMHESAAAWYNSAFAMQVDDDPIKASEQSERAEAHYDEASRVATEWGEAIGT